MRKRWIVETIAHDGTVLRTRSFWSSRGACHYADEIAVPWPCFGSVTPLARPFVSKDIG